VTLALRRSASSRSWLPLVVLGGLCVLMAGRRKAMMMPAVWMLVVLASYLRSRRMAATMALFGLLGLVLVGVVFVAGDLVDENYYSYAASTTRDAPDRLFNGAVGSVWTTFLQSGFLGSGIGTVAQGMSHIAGGVEQGWQESGPSRVLAELGVPGFVAALLLGGMLARACYNVMRRASPAAPGYHLQVGLGALVAANAASFLVSHQIYTDLSVMPLAALFLGACLSGPRWCVPPSEATHRSARVSLVRPPPPRVPA
jgi:O-antigen ligase